MDFEDLKELDAAIAVIVPAVGLQEIKVQRKQQKETS